MAYQLGVGLSLNQYRPVIASAPAGYTWSDADGADWYTRVVAAGGTITNANQAKFDSAFALMKANSNIWNLINQGYFFLGQESFGNGLFVPFYNTNSGSGLQPINTSSATNVGFGSGGYGKKTGIQDTSQSSYVNTGCNETSTSIWPSYILGFPNPDIGRHIYVNLGDCDGANNDGNFFGAGIPFGGSNPQTQKVLNGSYAINNGINNWDLTTFNINNDSIVTPYNIVFPNSSSDGGWGLPSTLRANGGKITFYAGSGNSGTALTGDPVSNPYSNNILIGGDLSNNSIGNTYNKIRCATLGRATATQSFDFAGMDTVVNTLMGALA